MIRALFSAVSGLTNEQEAMDVVGNNISNVNTVGFKASSTDFSEAFSQTERLANLSDPIGLDVGLGSRVVGTTTDFSQGALQQTSVASDVAVSGSGFFVVTTQSNPTGSATPNGNTLYTRAGDFVVDVNSNMRTSDGYYVQGYSVGTSAVDDTTETSGFQGTVGADFVATAPTGAIATSALTNIEIPTTIATSATTTEAVVSYNIGTNGSITVTGQDGTSVIIGYMPVATVQNEAGLNDQGAGYYATTQASGQPTNYGANTGNAGTLQSGALELSNADVATEFSNMIIIQNGYDANAKVITVANDMLQVADNLIQG